MILLIYLHLMLKFALSGRGLLRCPNDFLCHHEGICDPSGSCICKPGWTGDLNTCDMCEIEAIPCPTQPCVNGNCQISSDGRKYCQCDHRFEGQFCELDKDECALKVCPADAECLNHMPKHDKDKGYACICPMGYAGEHCEIEVDLCEVLRKKGENYCHNGGVCEARHVCMCQDGFGGSRCAHRVPLHREYEEFGCPERPEVCAKLFDDGRCDEICNRESCLFDGFDCAKHNDIACRTPSDCAYKFGDGKCDEECAGPECGYDGGDCERSQSATRIDGNMIGIAVGVPPDVAIKNLRQLQAELAQRLYTYVSLAEDSEGLMIFEWSVTGGQGSRISIIDEQLIAGDMSATINGTMVFFEVDVASCRLLRRRNQTKPQCFTDLRPAATYLTLELARAHSIASEMLPIRDITWKKSQKKTVSGTHSSLYLAVVCAVVCAAMCTLCTGVIAVIIRTRRKRKKVMFAPYWKIPGGNGDNKGGLVNNSYRPPTPPDTIFPDYCLNDSEDKKDDDNRMESVVDEESRLLLAVRRGDFQEVERMISSAEEFIDVVSNGLGLLHHAVANNDAKMLKMLIECGQMDIFQRNSFGQSPLVFAARLAHADLDCISILVKAIDDLRRKHYDDLLSENFGDIEANRYFRRDLRMFPLYDEADAKYALTDALGRNVLHYAALSNASHLIDYFSTIGANPNLIDNNGDAPIHLAAKNGNMEALLALMRNSCDVDIRDGTDRTAYELAEAQGHAGVCSVLLLSPH